LDDTGLLLLKEKTELLSGAVSRDSIHYLCTRGDSNNRKGGIFSVTETELLSVLPNVLPTVNNLPARDGGEQHRLFMGMIKLDDRSIIAVERNGGAFFSVDQTGFTQIRYSNGEPVATGKYATGALAVWQDSTGGIQMLTAGIQGGLYTSSSSSYSHGYVEFELDSVSGSLVTSTSRRDNTPDETVNHNKERYTATIGKHPVNYFFQAPLDIDYNKTFFASTQTSGLWSFRDRTGGWQWNAEN
jgi:hypothetical protein